VNLAPFAPSMVLATLPEILLLILAVIVLAADLVWRPGQRRFLGWLTAGGLLAILVAALAFSQPVPGQTQVMGGMLRSDWLSFAFLMLFLFVAAVVSLISIDVEGVGNHGEYYLLLVIATLGMSLMAASADLIMLYLSIETTSIPLYVLAGYLKRDKKSAESGLKYFLFGALTSTVMLYGFSLLYGLTGETNLYQLAAGLQSAVAPLWVTGSVLILIVVGFGFKVAAVPFHFWTPDVYEGAPTPITAFISTGSKAAGFAVLVRVMLVVFPGVEPYWTGILAAMAVASMTLGNLLALAQHNIKRLLAYSSIAHAGYAMIGLVALSQLGVASAVFYLIAYVVTNLTAFAVVILVTRAVGSEEIADYAGLNRRAPGLSLVLLVVMLSLAGMPPLAGFVAKFYVFAAAVQSGWVWLAVVGVINAIIGLYYYLTVLKVAYLYRSEHEDEPILIPRPFAMTLGVCTLAIVAIGSVSAPWLDWAMTVARGLF
jgi:NADH-quinone oxidoreductase subunit N